MSASSTSGSSKSASSGQRSLDELQKALRSVEEAGKSSPGSGIASLLDAAGIRSPLILLSPEAFRLQRLVSFIHERLFASSPEALVSAHGPQLSSPAELSAFIGELLTPSLFARSQLLVIWNGEKLKAAGEKLLADALKRPLPNQLVAITAIHSPKNNPPLQLLSALGTVVTLPELQGESLKRWVAKEVERFGVAKSIDPAVVDVLSRAFEGNLSGLLGEIQRVSLVAGKDATIELRHLQGAALPGAEQSGNQLIQTIFRRDLRQALGLTRSLLESGMHPLQISAQLSKAYRVLLAEKGPGGTRHKDINAPWLLRQIGGRGASEAELTRGIEILKALDLALKDSGLEPEDSLGIAIDRLCRPTVQAAGASPE